MRNVSTLIALAACTLAGCFLSSTCLAQVTVEAKAKTAIKGLENPQLSGDAVLFDGGKPTYVPVGIIDISYQYGYIEVKATDANRKPVEIRKVVKEDPSKPETDPPEEKRPENQPAQERWLIMQSGEFWVNIRQYKSVNIDGVDMRIFADEHEQYIKVGDAPQPGPDPEPGPGPGPKPDDPFDGIAGRVSNAARTLGDLKRSQAARAFEAGATAYEKYQVRNPTDAWNYIQRNMPPCSNGDCVPLQNLLNADARNRTGMGRQEIIQYYREIAKGLK